MYRLITDDHNQFVGQATYEEDTGKVIEVSMYGEVYTDPNVWKEKFGLPDNING